MKHEQTTIMNIVAGRLVDWHVLSGCHMDAEIQGPPHSHGDRALDHECLTSASAVLAALVQCSLFTECTIGVRNFFQTDKFYVYIINY